MYCRARKTKGLTLIEMTLVIATIALLVGFGLPAVRALVGSFQSESGVRSMINAALSSARAMAIRNQAYTGVRFQMKCTATDPQGSPLTGLRTAPQYMIFVVHEEPAKMNGLTIGFRAIPGLKPIRLPETVAVMDLSQIQSDADMTGTWLSDATTFSILFSPSGKLVVHDIRVRNRDGVFRPDNDAGAGKTSMDDVFNSAYNILTHGRGMFLQDDYSGQNPTGEDDLEYGLGKEASRTSFVIAGRQKLFSTFDRGTAWTEYLSGPEVKTFYVSPYAGTVMSSE